jgi:hypothetical protein
MASKDPRLDTIAPLTAAERVFRPATYGDPPRKEFVNRTLLAWSRCRTGTFLVLFGRECGQAAGWGRSSGGSTE